MLFTRQENSIWACNITLLLLSRAGVFIARNLLPREVSYTHIFLACFDNLRGTATNSFSDMRVALSQERLIPFYARELADFVTHIIRCVRGCVSHSLASIRLLTTAVIFPVRALRGPPRYFLFLSLRRLEYWLHLFISWLILMLRKSFFFPVLAAWFLTLFSLSYLVVFLFPAPHAIVLVYHVVVEHFSLQG